MYIDRKKYRQKVYELIYPYCRGNIPPIKEELLFGDLETEDAVLVIEDKLSRLPMRDQIGSFPLTPHVLKVLINPEARGLIPLFHPTLRLRIYCELNDPEERADEIIENCQNVDKHEWCAFLNDVKSKISRDSQLIQFAQSKYPAIRLPEFFRDEFLVPTRTVVQKPDFKDPYWRFFQAVKDAVKPPSYQVQWAAGGIRNSFTLDDFNLACLWANRPISSIVLKAKEKIQYGTIERMENSILSKMISARCAEKTALQFYSNLYQNVKDVSITQDGQPGDWQTHDIMIRIPETGEAICIDVKNARTPVNHKKRYVDHCVPRFKNSRAHNAEVRIAGVLSRYIPPEQMLPEIYGPVAANERDEIPYIKMLGEFTASYRYQLSCEFTSQTFTITHHPKAVSPWMYDFPGVFYQEQEKARNILRNYDETLVPDRSECVRHGIIPIPTFVALSLPLHDAWKVDLCIWQLDFINDLNQRQTSRITLPVLYLHILKHFLQMAVCKDAGSYNPDGYREIIFPPWLAVPEFDIEFQSPLGIRDPLSIINDLITTLQKIWVHRTEIHLDQFSEFRFNGLGLLQGLRRGDKKLTTILAYCGGEIPGKGKCGYSPLILWDNGVIPCVECGKLICPECGFCSQGCSLCKKRMNEKLREDEGKDDSVDIEEVPTENQDISEPPEDPPFDFYIGESFMDDNSSII